MKKSYLQIIMTLLAFILPFGTEAAKVTFNFDDPSRINFYFNNYGDYKLYEGDLVPGDNVIECYNIKISAKEGYILDKVLMTNDTWAQDYPIEINNNSCENGFFSDSYVKVITKVQEEAQTESLVMNVDKASAVTVSVTETGRIINLVDGTNTITYDPSTEKQLKVYNSLSANLPLYSVTAPNSQSSVVKNGNIYNVNLPCTGPVNVVSQYPKKDCYINFTFAPGSEGFVKKITKDTSDGEEVQMVDNKVKVNAGTIVYIHGNTDDYNITSFTVDGSSVSWEDPFRIIVLEKDVNVAISSTKYMEAVVYITVEDASMVMARYGSIMYPGEEIKLVNGKNEVSINANKNVMFFDTANPTLYKLVKVTVDGEELESAYDGKMPTDYLYGGENIVVTAEKRVRDLEAVVYLDDEAAMDWNFVSIINQKYDLTSGYNRIKFCEDDNPFIIKGGKNSIYVYLDDDDVKGFDSGYMVNLGKGSVLKIFAAKESEPQFYTLTFAEKGFDNVSIKADEVNIVKQRLGYQYLEDTKIEITPTDTQVKGVTLDGEALKAGEGNVYTFKVSGAHNIEFVTDENPDAGVEGIEAEDGFVVIYNLNGLRVNPDKLNECPSGVYIINGKKVFLKK